MKISEDVLEFLKEPDVRDALVRNDIQKLYETAESRLAYYRLIGELTSILIQAGVDPLQGMTEIPGYFLYWQKNIKEFNIPEGITEIDVWAFRSTGLESITIPNSVKKIGDCAFLYCEDLKSIKLPAGVYLYNSAFNLSGLESIELEDVKLHGSFIFSDCSQLKSVIIKGNTPEIPKSTFKNCTNLTHVELPASLKEIEPDSFSNCVKLEEINFEGTAERWKNVEIKLPNAGLFGYKIICSDSTLRYNKEEDGWIEV